MTTIWHSYSCYEPRESEAMRRVSFAIGTWRSEYTAAKLWRPMPVVAPQRTSGELGDKSPMPFVKDIIDVSLSAAATDIIAFTNADACFTPGLTGWILDTVPRHGAAYTHRWDFARLTTPFANEAAVKRGQWYPGSDAFFFTVAWWKAHRGEYPDMILGREQCDEVLRQLVKRYHGREIPGAIYHEKHESFWDRPENHGPNPANRHNRILARKWFLKTGYRPNDAEWWRI